MADQTTTVSRLKRLPENSAFTHGVKVKYSDINDSAWTTDGDTVSVEFTGSDLPTKYVVTRAVADVTTAFATDGTLTYELGTDGDPNNFLTSTDAKTAGVEIAAVGAAPVTLAGSFGSAGDDIMLRFTTQGATGAPADITAGEIVVLLEILDISEQAIGL